LTDFLVSRTREVRHQLGKGGFADLELDEEMVVLESFLQYSWLFTVS